MYGRFGLRPWEFDQLSIAECEEMLTASWQHEARQDRKHMLMLAWLATHLMNATGNFKTPVTIEDLLGPDWADGEDRHGH